MVQAEVCREAKYLIYQHSHEFARVARFLQQGLIRAITPAHVFIGGYDHDAR